VLLALLALVLAGCGGGGAKKPAATQVVRGPGFSFRAPQDWRTVRRTRTISVAPVDGGPELVQVLYFRLSKPYRPSKFPQVILEIDAAVKQLAKQLDGTATEGETVTVGGLRGRRYELGFEKEGAKLHQRITFLLRVPRREFELLCQWGEDAGEPEACGVLTASFRPA
jgi:hypothetical protein